MSGKTIFSYHQIDDVLWADYSGGEIIKGTLIGTAAPDGTLDFHYQHINEHKQVRIGKCHSTPRMLADGKIELCEQWQWLNGDLSEGSSVIVEIEHI